VKRRGPPQNPPRLSNTSNFFTTPRPQHRNLTNNKRSTNTTPQFNTNQQHTTRFETLTATGFTNWQLTIPTSPHQRKISRIGNSCIFSNQLSSLNNRSSLNHSGRFYRLNQHFTHSNTTEPKIKKQKKSIKHKNQKNKQNHSNSFSNVLLHWFFNLFNPLASHNTSQKLNKIILSSRWLFPNGKFRTVNVLNGPHKQSVAIKTGSFRLLILSHSQPKHHLQLTITTLCNTPNPTTTLTPITLPHQTHIQLHNRKCWNYPKVT